MNLHGEVKNILKGNMKNIIFAFLILGLINFAFNKVADSVLPTEPTSIEEDVEDVVIDENISILPQTTGAEYLTVVYEKPYSYSIIKTFLSDIISFVIHGALSLGILDLIKAYYSKGEAKFKVESIFYNLGKYYKQLFLISTLMSTFSVILSLIPYIGPIVNIVLAILLIFVVLLIPENEEEGPFSLFKKSIEKSKGYRLKIISINVIYFFVPLLIFIIGLVIVWLTSASGSPVLLLNIFSIFYILIFIGLVLFFRAAIYVNVSIPLLFYKIENKNKRGINEDNSFVENEREIDNEFN